MSDPILIIDDEEETLLVFRTLLARLGREIDTARSIEEAERQLSMKRYCVVITDLRLTGVLGEEGLEILDYVRGKSPLTEVILITGYGSPEIMSRAYELGAAYYFEKPVHPLRLLDALKGLGCEH